MASPPSTVDALNKKLDLRLLDVVSMIEGVQKNNRWIPGSTS